MLWSAAVAADPHVAFVINRDAMVVFQPIVALAGSAPVLDQIAGLIEFENGRRGGAALRDERVGGGTSPGSSQPPR